MICMTSKAKHRQMIGLAACSGTFLVRDSHQSLAKRYADAASSYLLK